MELSYHVRPVYLKSPSKQHKGERELRRRNCFPVEYHVPCGACFSKKKEKMVLSCHTLNTHGSSREKFTLKTRKHLGMICSFSLLLQRMIKTSWIWGHLIIRSPWLCNTQIETHLNPVQYFSSSGRLVPHTFTFVQSSQLPVFSLNHGG